MRMRALPFLAVLTLLLGCADVSDPAVPAHSKSKSAEGDIAQLAAYPVILRIGGRDQDVIVRAGPTGPLVTATDGQGRTIVSGATMDELRAQRPDLYRTLNGQAQATVLDASIGD